METNPAAAINSNILSKEDEALAKQATLSVLHAKGASSKVISEVRSLFKVFSD